ncbi:MAG: transcription antitermination factor NusB [Candidatus Pacebacteria bacterium CG_4_10_14_3_um_filter_34_15]|nr:transcription antitermination factor NusB [Candidatus Pacearchaeota archaeon]NCQ65520.1 transcription antitermination factor NusB [Candidatus Paceibacterota bacterium]OIO45399.1 MAG: transcription antitermination factor NusB [Candidatus Pacebacteria bacterium CG1_02_43_31]PIQ80828.1 MAG: transcription antitermination factor NusB [Candidatus Pacebacteria bacterium CG11_big_fil_rev_8_21_14_0_20_34_55]PIX81095.1 MAG: transcription antitermination factor NusB [Candidatus Pacebacteria bacterium C
MPDHRHDHRVKLMQDLFACTFTPGSIEDCLKHRLKDSIVYQIVADLSSIDEQIQESAPERPLGDVNKVDLAILRLIVFESINKKTPKKVLLNEAIELAKDYSGEKSPGFVNGVLAKILLTE